MFFSFFFYLKNYELLLKKELLKWCKSIFPPNLSPFMVLIASSFERQFTSLYLGLCFPWFKDRCTFPLIVGFSFGQDTRTSWHKAGARYVLLCMGSSLLGLRSRLCKSEDQVLQIRRHGADGSHAVTGVYLIRG